MNRFLCTAFALTVVAADTATAEVSFGPPVLLGQIRDQAVKESSGLTSSQWHEDILWTLNDSGNSPDLFAIDRSGLLKATVAVAGVENYDWEALTSMTWNGTRYLIVGDVGDNYAEREYLTLHFIPEPSVLPTYSVQPEFSINFGLSGGATDVEALIAMPQENAIYLLTKRERPPHVHRLALARTNEMLRTERLDPLLAFPPPPTDDGNDTPERGRYSSQPTDMAISPSGQAIAILSYRRILFFERASGEPVSKTLTRTPIYLEIPPLMQAEAITFDGDDSLILSSEKWPAPLVLYRVNYAQP